MKGSLEYPENRIKNALVFLGAVLLFANCTLTAADRPPNILIITVDNLGYGDLKSYDPNSEIITPHLDRIGKAGARLTSFYTVLTGQTTESPHESFYFKYQDHAAFRFQNWKIVREKQSSAWSLFDLAGDISETKDQAERYPEKVAAMEKMFSLKSEELSKSR